MIASSFLLALTLAVPNAQEPRDFLAVTRVADRLIEITDQDPATWRGTKPQKLSGLSVWYTTLGGARKESYDRLRETVRRAHCFERPVRMAVEVSSIVQGKDGRLLVEGFVAARTEPAREYYTKDQKEQIADVEKAMRDMRERHQWHMRTLEDGTPYKADRIQRFHDAIVEMGQHIQVLRHEFDPAAEKRRARGERLSVKVTVDKSLTSSIDLEQLDLVNRMELVAQVTDFHIRPPLEDFGRPAALGSIEGTVLTVGGLSYRPPVSTLDDPEEEDVLDPGVQ